MVVGDRSVEGVTIDAGYQHISEAPAYNDPDGETVEVVDDAPVGEERVVGVSPPREPPDIEGQTTLDDWRWSR
jgi:hypothetical protein